MTQIRRSYLQYNVIGTNYIGSEFARIPLVQRAAGVCFSLGAQWSQSRKIRLKDYVI